MFKSLSQKAALLFTLCFTAIFAIMLFLWAGYTVIGSKYSFESSLNRVFTEERISAIEKNLSESIELNPYTDSAKTIYDSFMEYSSDLGIDFERSFSVLSQNCNVIYTSSSEMTDTPECTPAIARALTGERGMTASVFKSYSDFAVSLKDGTGATYIAYVKDTDEFMLHEASTLLAVGLILLFIGAIAAFIMGIRISRHVTVPIKQLSRSAKKLADGDINTIKLIGAGTELNELSDTIVNLSKSLDETNEKAKREQTKLETILQNMTDGILAFDLKGRLIHINHEAQRLLNRNYLENANFDTLFMELRANITMGDLLYINRDDEILERQVTTQTDTVINMTFTTFSQDNKISGILVVLRDITNEERLEEARKNFVADVSHELRTPLTNIKSYSETLIQTPDAGPELSGKFLNVISSEADRMARIISDLLTLSQLDSKHNTYKQPETIDVRAMLESVTDRLTLTAKKKDQILAYNPINEVPQILGDKDALERVIINIIGNALKYTQTGGRIDVYSSKVYNDICIKVVDNGIGIPEENLPHIFDRFYRVDKARSRDKGGTGLGLAIAKQTIEKSFNGNIIISSEYHKGTEVIITLPTK